jgi:hypothetical protein
MTIELTLTVSPFEQNSGTSKAVPSLYPVYLHHRSQHLVTTSIQNLLEKVFYIRPAASSSAFGKKKTKKKKK